MLIDSELLAVRADVACLAEDGIAQTEEEILERYVGISMTAMKADLERRFGGRLRDDFDTRHAVRLCALFEAELQPIAGVAAILDQLSGKVCVASSSAPERLRHALGLVGLYDRFDPHVFSATMVARGKPAPDLFLHAAERMGVEPARCVVVEDSVPGVIAGREAGMTVIGFTGGGHCGRGHDERLRSAGAVAIVETMAEFLLALSTLPPRLR